MRKIAIGIAAIVALIGAPAFAADMAVKAPPPPPAAAPTYNWSGFYIGGNLGYGWDKDPTITLLPNDALGPGLAAFYGGSPPIPFGLSGVVGGVELGYNWQFNQAWLVGLETDFDAADVQGSGAAAFSSIFGVTPLTATTDEHVDWFGTVRLRLGYLPTNNFLIYGTGGLAYGRVAQSGNFMNNSSQTISEHDGSCNSGTVCFSGSSGHITTGWTVGGGLEYSVWANWTVKAEYLYVSLNGPTFIENVVRPGIDSTTAAYFARSSDIDFQVVRGGINYKF